MGCRRVLLSLNRHLPKLFSLYEGNVISRNCKIRTAISALFFTFWVKKEKPGWRFQVLIRRYKKNTALLPSVLFVSEHLPDRKPKF